MSQHILQQLQQIDLLQVKQKLFNSSTSKQSDRNYLKKNLLANPTLQTTAKKIKLRHRLKTEFIATTPRGVRQARIRTSPNNKYRLKHIEEFKTYKFEAKNHSTNKNKSMADQSNNNYPNNFSYNRLVTQTYGQIYPSSKRQSLSYRQIQKQIRADKSISNQRQRQNLSKSRKKQIFTIFKQKQKTSIRQKHSQSNKLEYELPYRYHSSITIDLLNRTITNNQQRQKSKSSKKSQSSNKKQKSINRTKAIGSLIQFQDDRISKAFNKIERIKFVFEYMSHTEIIYKLQSYAFLNQPQCKWLLLIVEEVFKRKKKEGETSAF